jgi:hypothetical protein
VNFPNLEIVDLAQVFISNDRRLELLQDELDMMILDNFIESAY